MNEPMTPTHEEVLAAIAQVKHWADEDCCLTCDTLCAHCDDLRATAERHAPAQTAQGFEHVPCRNPFCGGGWPCLDYQQAVNRLQSWGYLGGEHR